MPRPLTVKKRQDLRSYSVTRFRPAGVTVRYTPVQAVVLLYNSRTAVKQQSTAAAHMIFELAWFMISSIHGLQQYI